MVCAKCLKATKRTELATPGVKRKNDAYMGSSMADKSKSSSSSSATAGSAGIGKSKLLSKSARNPYAAYSSSCETCKTKVAQGYRYCQRCAYKASNGKLTFHSNLGFGGLADSTQHVQCVGKARTSQLAQAPLFKERSFRPSEISDMR